MTPCIALYFAGYFNMSSSVTFEFNCVSITNLTKSYIFSLE